MDWFERSSVISRIIHNKAVLESLPDGCPDYIRELKEDSIRLDETLLLEEGE